MRSNQRLILSYWQNSCRRAQMHAAAMAQNCLPKFGDLIVQETQKFCALPAPTNEKEEDVRKDQGWALNSKVRCIAFASKTAVDFPGASEQAYK